MNCSKCNANLENGDMFCPLCGEPVQQPMQQPMRQPAYRSVYNNSYPARRKSNAGAIVAVIFAIIAVCAAIIATIVFIEDRSNNEEISYPIEETYKAPVFDYAVGSSTRSYDVDTAINQKVYYYSEYVMDGNMATAWTPDRHIDHNPSITLYAAEKQKVRGIRMTNGYCKSERTYTMNKRVSRVRVSYAGGEVIADFAMNHYREMLDVPFNQTVETDSIVVQILDTYYGEWEDIAISEIEVY